MSDYDKGDEYMKTKPWMMLTMVLAGWINRQQQEMIEYQRFGLSIHRVI